MNADRPRAWANAPTEIQQLRAANARLLAEVDLYRARLRFLGGLISTSLTAVQEATDVLMDLDGDGASLSLVRHHLANPAPTDRLLRDLKTTTPSAAATAEGETTPTNP